MKTSDYNIEQIGYDDNSQRVDDFGIHYQIDTMGTVEEYIK